ncbi:hypothetical protein VTI28DRAFT_10265 [Corynascus sepedonium]
MFERIFNDIAAPLLDRVTNIARGQSVTLSIVTVLVATYLLLYRCQLVKAHPNEPPIIPSAVPFIGHVLGMLLFGGRYVKNLGLRNPDKPIFTLPIPRSRMYIVTDPSLAMAVQRASKTLSFTPLVPDITKRVFGLDEDTVTIVRQHLDPAPREPRGFLADMHDLVYAYFGPGKRLDELSLDAVRQLARQVDEYAAMVQREDRKGSEVDLLGWIRHLVAVATANLLYGDENPISLHPELESAFWDFDHGLGLLLIGIFPSIIARKAYRGREALAAALEEYLVQNRHVSSDEGRRGASRIVQKRVAIARDHGWTLRMTARSELSFLFAGIVNTATTTFWMVLHLFASASSSSTGADNLSLLSKIRSELSSVISPDPESHTEPGLVLSLERLKSSASCPALDSLFRECLRRNSDTYSTRLVKSPTTLSGPAPGGSEGSQLYHLTADSVVQISGGTMHADPQFWGPDADKFDPSRFLSVHSRNNNDNKTTTTNTHPAAFRAFGGGKTLCPGRHFAAVTIKSLVALLATKFDITAAPHDGDGDGGIAVPDKEDGVLPVHVLEPKRQVRVKVRVRDQRAVRVVA